METINNFLAQLAGLTMLQIALISILVIAVWFLPAMIAVVLNPSHAKYILVACIPAGFSLIAWSGLLVWACTGKVFERYKDKVKSDIKAT
ncbi:superinfection immunity protein [Agaribacter marinus]|uniref:Superinfection immunity protein n=1 Tax=Agaribacter marinus TaxID=1431249 RepID=A0AA37T4N5_9ALTE|nr:superinfection immunity protein [Agaribacter marinus]GLR71305.1 hypothetical protein GCM10007852_22130 [Agaribacter marinus]